MKTKNEDQTDDSTEDVFTPNDIVKLENRVRYRLEKVLCFWRSQQSFRQYDLGAVVNLENILEKILKVPSNGK